MIIVHSDSVFEVPAGSQPDYDSGNPLLRLMALQQRMGLAAEREWYMTDSIQYLVPIRHLEMYSPQAPNQSVTDPTAQDSKTDFQKQNVRSFLTSDTQLSRGWVNNGEWTTPFLRLSYRGGPDSNLSQASGHNLGAELKVFLRVGDAQTAVPVRVPYNELSDRYDIELWGYPGDDLRKQLDTRGRSAYDRGELVARPDLLRGALSDFAREGLDERSMIEIAPDNTMHPIRPLHVQVAWSDSAMTVWDSNDGANYRYEFGMIVRGWDNYLGVGLSPNPHGGTGSLEYRNLLSNYFGYSDSGELARRLEPWNFDAFGSKQHSNTVERFLAVDYMDLHILRPNSGIGLHRHRDNQEVFLLMGGRGLMVIGDWAQQPTRERCLEIRTLRPGHLAMLKGGNLHGLMNTTDEDMELFMFGGYD